MDRRLRLFEENNINGGPFHAGVGPTITSSATFSAVENQTAVGTVTATGTGPLTTYITGGADAAKFAINSATGVITFVSAPDFEIPTDVGGNNVYDLTVTTAGPGGTATQAIAVTVTDSTADNPPVITSSATFNAAENQTAVGTVTATGQTPITYAFTGGADDALFAINSSSGVLTFLVAPDFEAPGDVGADNIYNISVSATNALGSAGQNIAITVTDTGLPAGMIERYQFNTGITDTGGAVDQWDGQIGGHHLTAPANTTRPTKQGDGSILYDGINDRMNTGAWVQAQPITVVALMRHVTWTTNLDYFDTDARMVLLGSQSGGTPNVQLYAGSAFTVTNANLPVNTYKAIACGFSGASSYIHVSGTTPTTGNPGTAGINKFYLGANIVPGLWSNTQWKEIQIYGRLLSEAECNEVFAYLNTL